MSSAIGAEPALADRFTWAPRVVAVVSDGTAVLGLGDIGPTAALPVMEGKACLFAEFAGLSSVPVVLSTTDVDTIVATVEAIAPSFGGINLEDISAPRCFEIEERLRERLDIPVMHDDQHGTAILVLAALRNAARVVGRELADLRVVVSGAGAAGVASTRILLEAGVGDIAVGDSTGVLHTGRDDLTPIKRWIAENTNRAGYAGTTSGALEGADVYLGLSGGSVPESVIASMAPDCIVFSLANPTPEVDPGALGLAVGPGPGWEAAHQRWGCCWPSRWSSSRSPCATWRGRDRTPGTPGGQSPLTSTSCRRVRALLRHRDGRLRPRARVARA